MDRLVVIITLGGAELSLFTLGGAAYWITLRVGAWIGIGCTMQNMYANQRSAAFFSVPIFLYGAACARFYRVWMRSRAAWDYSSADDMHGIGNPHGKNSTVSLICVALFLSM